MGTFVGVLGAIVQALVSRNRMFLRCTYPLQVLVLAAATAVPGLLIFHQFAFFICAIATVAAWLAVKTLHRSPSNSRWSGP
jgi:hypothetical protein